MARVTWRGYFFALMLGVLCAAPARAAEPPPELRQAVAQFLTALQKQDEKAIVALLDNPEQYADGGVLAPASRTHLFARPEPYARSISEMARDWGIQSHIRMLGNGNAVAVFHTWGTKFEALRDEDYGVAYFICRFRPTKSGWKVQRLC